MISHFPEILHFRLHQSKQRICREDVSTQSSRSETLTSNTLSPNTVTVEGFSQCLYKGHLSLVLAIAPALQPALPYKAGSSWDCSKHPCVTITTLTISTTSNWHTFPFRVKHPHCCVHHIHSPAHTHVYIHTYLETYHMKTSINRLI